MKAFAVYIKGWGISVKHWKMWGLLYVFNILFALLLTLPVFQYLNHNLSHTLALDKLYEQFDFAIFDDILNEYGHIVGILINQSMLSSLLFLIFSIFLVGGILSVFRHRDIPFRFAGFWVGCSKYFWRIFGLTLFFLIIQGLIAMLFFFLFNGLTSGGLDRFASEVIIYRRAIITFWSYSFVSMIFWMIQDYCKVLMVQEDLSLFRSIIVGIKFVFRHFFSTFPLYFLNLLTFAILLYIYWQIPTGNAVGAAFLIGQLFLLLRIGTKLLNLGSATVLVENHTL